jgi:ubiquinone/menaquinone biosynthesis C-methylase UbiE
MDISVESTVKLRYAEAAQTPQAALCCPAPGYNLDFLNVIPQEVIEKDYGCGDPSPYLREGETVLDLGSGTGKICFIAAQIVGPRGRVIGIDMTDDMLEVARRNAPIVAARLGYANVEFRKGRIQDLALDLERFETALKQRPVVSTVEFFQAEELARALRQEQPLVATASVDVVVSNCVLNLVETGAKCQLFAEIYRVLKPDGRAVISDIVANAEVPDEMQRDAELWTGCISGAMREDLFVRAFEDAGFGDVRVLKRDSEPWRTVGGIQFRSLTVEANKGALRSEAAAGCGGDHCH